MKTKTATKDQRLWVEQKDFTFHNSGQIMPRNVTYVGKFPLIIKHDHPGQFNWKVTLGGFQIGIVTTQDAIEARQMALELAQLYLKDAVEDLKNKEFARTEGPAR